MGKTKTIKMVNTATKTTLVTARMIARYPHHRTPTSTTGERTSR